MKRLQILLALNLMLVIGCQPDAQFHYVSAEVETKNELPECNEAYKNNYGIVANEKTIYYCNGQEWVFENNIP